jgi:hypothetical protein
MGLVMIGFLKRHTGRLIVLFIVLPSLGALIMQQMLIFGMGMMYLGFSGYKPTVEFEITSFLLVGSFAIVGGPIVWLSIIDSLYRQSFFMYPLILMALLLSPIYWWFLAGLIVKPFGVIKNVLLLKELREDIKQQEVELKKL